MRPRPIRQARQVIAVLVLVLVLNPSTRMQTYGAERDQRPSDRALSAPAYQPGFPRSVSAEGIETSSPAVGDVDRDGDNEVFVGDASGMVYGWDHLGNTLPGFPISTGDRAVVAAVALGDLDGDGDLEVVAGTSSIDATGAAVNRARVFAWQHTGTLLSGWPQTVFWDDTWAAGWSWSEVTSVVVADVVGDSDLEVLAATTANTAEYPDPSSAPAAYNAYVWDSSGTVASGWPTADLGDPRVAIYGLLAAGDLSGNGQDNPIVPRDYNVLYSYEGTGSPLAGWPVYVNEGSNTVELGVSAPVLADLDQDGIVEIVALGILQAPDGETRLSSALVVLEPDGSRRAGWTSAALGAGWTPDQVCAPYGAVSIANLDQDADLEIVASTNDGYVRAYDHNSTTPKWAFDYRLGETMIAGEAAIGDIDGDEQVEIVFGTYQAEFQSTSAARVWALERDGTVANGFPLNVPGSTGLCATPALADLDGDGDIELVVGVKADVNQLLVWDLAGKVDPLRMPWPQARHNPRRTATYAFVGPNLTRSRHAVLPTCVAYAQTADLILEIRNHGDAIITDTITATVQLPNELTITGEVSLSPDLGTAITTSHALTWTGILDTQQAVTIGYTARVDTVDRAILTSQAQIRHAVLDTVTLEVSIFANGTCLSLPVIAKYSQN